MRRPNRILLGCVYAAFALLAAAPLTIAASGSPAVAVQTGNITGRVQNVVTGQHLNNARVSVKGTDRVAFTDQTGSYRLSAVPSGPVVVEVFFTGLDPQQIPLTVPAGQTLEKDVNLTSRDRYGDTDAVKLDSFVVSTSRETDGEAADPSQLPGRITVRNTGLRPWSADNYDVSVEFYTERGGLLSAGAFRKDIQDFFGDVVRIATEADLRELGLDPRYALRAVLPAHDPRRAADAGGEGDVLTSRRPRAAARPETADRIRGECLIKPLPGPTP
ncbi:MAG: TonB-dependent receptor [Verrucomicrobia bacterium]|nr:TonB-dependent receptor [Verrucomicrobiota bacterium]